MSTFRCDEHGVTVRVEERGYEAKGKKHNREHREVTTKDANHTGCSLLVMPALMERVKGEKYKDKNNKNVYCNCDIKEVE